MSRTRGNMQRGYQPGAAPTEIRARTEPAREEAWFEENREAIAEYNVRITERGVFSDTWRRF